MNNIMKKLLKIELERALKNKWFYICLLIGFAIVARDIYSVAYNTRKYYYLYVNDAVYQFPGTYCKWMVTNCSSMYKLLHLIFPLLISVPYSYTIYSDIKGCYVGNIISRTDKKLYYGSKLITQFITGFLVVFIILTTSFIATAAFLPLEHPTIASFTYGVHQDVGLGRLFYTKPFLSACLYIILEALVFGVIGCISFVFAYILTNGIIVMLSPFIIYYAEFVIGSALNRPYMSVMSRIGLLKSNYIVPLCMELAALVIIIGVSYIVRVNKKDTF